MMEVITVEEARHLENQERILILDLRQPEIYQQFHIDHAVCYSPYKIEKGEYCLPKDYCMILYCEHGGMSMAAARILGENGFCVKTVVGGMRAYREYLRRKD